MGASVVELLILGVVFNRPIYPAATFSFLIVLSYVSGDSNADILNHPQCSLYLLYLIKNDEEHYFEYMTLYVHQMVLMQHTNRQSLKQADNDVKSIKEISVNPLAEKKLTKTAEMFVKKIIKNFAKMNYAIDSEELKNFIRNLPPTEQWLITIPYGFKVMNSNNTAYDQFVYTIIQHIPFIVEKIIDGDRSYSIPSTMLINYFLEQIVKEPIKDHAIFGRVGLEKLAALHDNNLHPVALYSPDVVNNIYVVHTQRVGPVLNWLHDIGHIFWASMLTFTERQFILDEFIPCLKELLLEAKQKQDEEVAIKLQKIIANLYDYDLTNIKFHQSKDRLSLYLNRCFAILEDTFFNGLYPPGKFVNTSLDNCAEDRIYFLLNRMLHSRQFSSANDQQIWQKVIDDLRPAMDCREAARVDEIEYLAKYAAGVNLKCDNTRLFALQCNQLLTSLSQIPDNEKFWKKITVDFVRESHILIRAGLLMAFYPYMPLARDKRSKLMLFLLNGYATSAKRLFPFEKLLLISSNAENIFAANHTFLHTSSNTATSLGRQINKPSSYQKADLPQQSVSTPKSPRNSC